MQCERCGAEIRPDALSCEKCGAPPPPAPAAKRVKVEDAQVIPAPEETIRAEHFPVADTKSDSKGGRTCLWLVLGCAGFVLVMGCLCVMLFAFGLASIPREFQAPLNELLALTEGFDDSGESLLLEGLQPGEETGLVQPTDTPAPTPEPSPDFMYEGVSLSYREWLDVNLQPEVVPLEPEGMFGPIPEHLVIHVGGYPLPDTFHQPAVYIYRTADLEAMEIPIDERLDELAVLLETQPASPENIPFIVFWNAGAMVLSNVEYFEFKNGSAVRFLSQYGQALWPVNNKDLFYGFQGLTDGGDYVITAVFPISHPSLPPDGETYLGGDFESFMEGYEDYLAQVEAELNSYPPETFSPALNQLDAMMQSIEVR
jgi:hypothetical protein